MFNLLIIDSNITDSAFEINAILQKFSRLRIFSIVTNLDDGIKILNEGKIDITIIKTTNSCNEIKERLKSIAKKHHNKYKKSILILSVDAATPNKHPFVYSILNYKNNFEEICYKINDICKIKSNDIIVRKTINSELSYLGYNPSHLGTKYINDVITLLYTNSDFSDNLTQDIYPIIAKKYKTTVNNVKCNIAQATSYMYYECDSSRLQSYLCFTSDTKPRPKEIISTVLSKITYLLED